MLNRDRQIFIFRSIANDLFVTTIPSMGKQYKKTEKRTRRLNYIKRKKEAAKVKAKEPKAKAPAKVAAKA